MKKLLRWTYKSNPEMWQKYDMAYDEKQFTNQDELEKARHEKDQDPDIRRTNVYIIVTCSCYGNDIVCDQFTNTCGNCEADYNMNGIQLAPRSQWGEETGETYSDIMRGGDPWDE
jgi:hypothetical protein